MRDPYDVLGVAKNASAKDIKAAYRKLAKKFHPDQNPGDAKAKDRFSAINQAYEIVGDEKKRGAFDRGEIDAEGKQRFQGFEGAGGGDPFAGFRGQAGPGGTRFEFRSGGPGGPGGPGGFDAGDIFSDLFGQAFSGGAGAEAARPCAVRRRPERDARRHRRGGRFRRQGHTLPDGRKLAVKLPHYVEDGQTIRLKGQGEAGPGGAGDALVKIRFRRHPRYTVDGRDLHVDLPVPLADAVLGAKLPVETPSGRLAVNVPAWSSSDKVLRLRGKGLPEKAGGHGDVYVHVRIMLPDADAELEELMRREYPRGRTA